MSVAVIILAACPSPTGGGSGDDNGTSTTLNMPGIGTVRFTLISGNGGRVAWYTGTAGHQMIAFDSRSALYNMGGGLYDYRTDIYLMEPDGSGRTCLTCGISTINDHYDAVIAARIGDHDGDPANDDLPGFFLGQPEWHPDGRHIIMQVENTNSRHNSSSFQSFGQDQDLWILDSQTLSARPVLEHAMTGAAFLHPRLSRSGNSLVFAARNNGGAYGNIWDHWWLATADFDIDAADPSDMISGIQYHRPNGRGFYETTGFLTDSETEFSYSFTGLDGLAVPGIVDDGYVTDSPYNSSAHIVNLPAFWDEKPRYSPSGDHIVIMSNRFQTDWKPADGAQALSSELYLGPPGGTLHQLTDFGSFSRYAGKKLLVSDHEWNAAGDRLVVLVQPHGTGQPENGEIWLVELPRSY